LTYRNPGAFASHPVFTRFLQDLNHLVLAHLMAMYMRQAGCRIDVESRLHNLVEFILTPKPDALSVAH
jgi:hypothetical protein